MTRNTSASCLALALALGAAAATHADQLYSIDILQHQLVTLDTETGAVTMVGFVTPAQQAPMDLTYFDDAFYAVTELSSFGILQRIDPATGAIRETNALQFNGQPVGRTSGLAVRNGALLVGFAPVSGEFQATHLGRLDTDGTIHDVVDLSGVDANFFGLTESPNGAKHFSIDSGLTNDLHGTTVQPPSYTFIGGGAFNAVNDLVFAGGKLWALSSIAQDQSLLHQLDPNTGDIIETVTIDVFPGQSLFTGLARLGGQTCDADLDHNGNVGFSDVLTIIAEWGPCGSPCDADIDGSGDVGFGDVLAAIGAWGSCP